MAGETRVDAMANDMNGDAMFYEVFGQSQVGLIHASVAMKSGGYQHPRAFGRTGKLVLLRN